MRRPWLLKTTALLARINHLLALGTPPESILVLTFSKAAVGVIRSRMLEVPTGDPCSDKLEHVRVMTCHKFSIGVIKSVKPRNECGLLSEEEAQTLLIEAIALVTKRCEQQQIWTGASQSVRNQRLANLKVLTDHLPRVSQFIEYARASLSTMQDVLDSGRFNQLAPFTKVLPAIRDCYINLMKKNGNIDYTGTLLRAARLLSKAARPLPYSHVLVDEYQDCSAAQVQVLAALAQEPERSIMVFGDGDQAIYGFSGAAHTPLKSVLSDVVEMPLPVSQRLTAETAALASAIAHHRPTLAIQTERTGEKPRLVMSRSMRVQLPKIVNAISSLIESGVQPNQIAVLARKKAQLRPVEQALLANSIDTERKGATRNKDQAITVLKLVNGIEKLATLSQADAVDLMAHFVEHINLLSNRDLIREAAVSFRYAFRSRP
ncbi:MAG: ATP-dependent helicase [Betaproteobacteria bacterium]|nr:ATP-dependent helicase [Betaproteobacteria bacterium]